MFAFRFALKNVTSRKSSIVIILFIAFSISLLVVSNAVFDGTDNGLEKTFINSFTGNIVIRPKAEFPLSLFGNDSPLHGELSAIPSLIPYTELADYAASTEGVSVTIPQLSGFAAVCDAKDHAWFCLFGVEAEDYVREMSGIRILEGRTIARGERGIMMSRGAIAALQKETEAEEQLKLGENVKVWMSDGVSLTIRSLPLVGIYDYAVENETLNRIVLVDPVTLRELSQVRDFIPDDAIDPTKKDIMIDDMSDLDELFSSSADSVGVEAEGQDFNMDAVIAPSDKGDASQSTVWSFIICKTEEKARVGRIIRQMNADFKKRDWPVQAVKWRKAAGGTVNYIFYLRVILNVGIILILLTGFIVIANTLIVVALGRVCETGTLRAIGAKRHFIALQFFYETAILTVSAGILGCLFGALVHRFILFAHIHINNALLVQLFGGSVLETVLRAGNICGCLALSLALAVLGWLYPVRVALESNPIEAMRGQI